MSIFLTNLLWTFFSLSTSVIKSMENAKTSIDIIGKESLPLIIFFFFFVELPPEKQWKKEQNYYAYNQKSNKPPESLPPEFGQKDWFSEHFGS